MTTFAHAGGLPGIREHLIPVDFQDRLFPMHFGHASSGRGDHPTIEIYSSAIFPKDPNFRGAIAVEDATTNLVGSASNKHIFENWNIYQGATVTITQGQPDPEGGNGATRIQTSGGTSNTKYYVTANGAAGVSGTPCATSVWVKNNLDVPMKINPNLGGAVTINKSDGWVKVKILTTANGTSHRQIQFFSNSIGDSLDVLAFQPQIEEKLYCTSFVPDSRPAGRVSYPKEIFPTDDFTVNLWIAPTGDTRIASQNRLIFGLGTDYTTSRMTLWNYAPITADTPNRRIILDAGFNASNARQARDLISPTLFVQDKFEMITVTYQKSTMTYRVYRNGVYWDQLVATKLQPVNSVELSDCGWYYGKILICPRVVNDSEIFEWFNHPKAVYDPYDYFANFG